MRRVAILGAAWCGVALGQQPTGQAIRDTAREILSQKAYEESTVRRVAFDFSWLTDPIMEWWEAFSDAVQRMMSTLPPGMDKVVMVILLLILIGIVVHLAYTLRFIGGRRSMATLIGEVEKPATASELLARSEALAAEGNHVDASRVLYEASLALLEEKRHGRVRRGLTANEYLGTFQADWVRDNLRIFVDLINWKWYRARNFERQDYERCREAYEAIRTRLDEEFA